MLEKVIENWTSRLDYIRASRGSPMPDIIFKRHNVEPFLDKLITEDEKWILYENINRKKNLTANQEHHHQQFQNQVSINEKYCFVCGGTGKEPDRLILSLLLQASQHVHCHRFPYDLEQKKSKLVLLCFEENRD
ncbi:histone-lysine N-methyltransferase SETMAR [Trichonephila clavipes]|uniref:Histone-lysine N-methyltransferase SETMAR n=1 Tax=Trichonephila clavipes TaxID=2585209 RepID=A0A8X6WL75_TRICX|nr:histone-lysine N-methyltransferase SETMAR [Trichonephila clavipes]